MKVETDIIAGITGSPTSTKNVCKGSMYVIIGSQFVSHKGKVLLISLGIVTITLYVIERQMPLNVRYTTVCLSFKNLLSNSKALRLCYFHLLWKRCRSLRV